jgi:excisionase family DNA binding protein
MSTPESDSVVLVTLDEAARRLSVCRRTIEREILYGRFPRPLKVGRSTRVPVADLDAYIEKLRSPNARAEYIESCRMKHGNIAATPEVLDLLSKYRPPGMKEEDYQRLSQKFHEDIGL